MTPLRDLQRAFFDAVDVATFRPARVQPVDGYAGPWTAAAVMCFVGSVASARQDLPATGWALATGVLVLAALAYWSRANDEALQRSYVGAALCGVFGILYAITPYLPARIALCAWLAAAWFTYMFSHDSTPSR